MNENNNYEPEKIDVTVSDNTDSENNSDNVLQENPTEATQKEVSNSQNNCDSENFESSPSENSGECDEEDSAEEKTSEDKSEDSADSVNRPIIDTGFEGEPSVNPEIVSKKEENIENKKGFRVFVLALCLTVALSSAMAAGYYLGKNNTKKANAANYSVDLESKPGDGKVLTAESVYNAVNPSIVGIVVYNSSGIKGYASGVVYSEDGYIITNDHIYEDVANAKFKVYAYDGKSYEAEFVAGDNRSDLAVLKIDADGFFPATFGNSDELNYGERVYAIGRPNDATAASSITGGYISFLNRRVQNSTNYSSRLIQTDSAVNPGSSGGALVNEFGQVIGITSSKLVGSQYEGIGYAIPTTTVKRIVESLIANHEVIDRAKLGITYREIDSITAEVSNTNAGLYIASVNGNDDLAKKVEAGDIITAVNGIELTDADIILDIIENAKPGDKITFSIVTKSGTAKTVETKLVADKSESSYLTENSQSDGDTTEELPKNDSSGDSFNFPYGY